MKYPATSLMHFTTTLRPFLFAGVFLAVCCLLAPEADAQTTRYVATTGSDTSNCINPENPCATISYAIGEAGFGDTIAIADGVYTEPDGLDINISLTLRGESEAGTIIQAHESPGEATSRVITIVSPVTVEITNLTIRHGVSLGAWPDGGDGGGIYNQGASLHVINVTFSENRSKESGGGVYNLESFSSTFTNVTFSENRAGFMGSGAGGGGMFNYLSSPILRNVTFSNNEGHGGGGMLNHVGSSAVLTDVIFIDNRANFIGGGMSNQGGSAPLLKNVTFIGNEAQVGGGLGDFFNSSGTPILVNVAFIGNKASGTGGGIYTDFSVHVLINATLTENEAGSEGGGIYSLASELTLVNSIVWGNTAEGEGNEIYNDGSISIHYSLYSDGEGDVMEGFDFTVENSITENPDFIDPDNGDFRLAEGSSAINVGDPETDLDLFPTDNEGNVIDLDGNPRLRGGRIDIGAYEWQGDGEPGPANDHIANAIVIPAANATYEGTNVDATLEDGEPEPSCTFGDWTTNFSVWWRFTADDEVNRVNINTFDSDFDTIISLHRADNLEEVACNDDTDDSVQSQIVDAPIVAGEAYLIRVAGYDQSSANQGEIQLTAEFHWVSGEPGSETFVTSLTAPSPNPVRGTASFSLTVDREQNVTVEMFDVMGRRVQTLYEGSATRTETRLTLDASSLSSGMYIIRATGEDFMLTQRVTVIR